MSIDRQQQLIYDPEPIISQLFSVEQERPLQMNLDRQGADLVTNDIQGNPISKKPHLGNKQQKKKTNETIGTVTFRPLEGKFSYDKDPYGKVEPYCRFKIGRNKGRSSVAKSDILTPTWGESIILKLKNEEFAKLKVKDRRHGLSRNKLIGSAKMLLEELITEGRIKRWLTIRKKDVVTGEILVEMEFHPRVVL